MDSKWVVFILRKWTPFVSAIVILLCHSYAVIALFQTASDWKRSGQSAQGRGVVTVSLVSFSARSIAFGKNKNKNRGWCKDWDFCFVLQLCSCVLILQSNEKWEWVVDLRWMGQNQFIFVKNKYSIHQKNYMKWNYLSSSKAVQWSVNCKDLHFIKQRKTVKCS